MVSAVLSIILGVLSIIGTVPRVFPVFGLALGINAILKETKIDKRKSVIVISILGLMTNGLVTVVFILRGFLK